MVIFTGLYIYLPLKHLKNKPLGNEKLSENTCSNIDGFVSILIALI